MLAGFVLLILLGLFLGEVYLLSEINKVKKFPDTDRVLPRMGEAMLRVKGMPNGGKIKPKAMTEEQIIEILKKSEHNTHVI